ncbi:hypothetical protein [Bacillus litorisediminis]|uniref:hypothetical protein n=1 Tax=Bacillus litorisediminis TaxID=2922713 RepID=UPI001FB0200F|nr:hypothetical protein [Bacillus litorisediminis]
MLDLKEIEARFKEIEEKQKYRVVDETDVNWLISAVRKQQEEIWRIWGVVQDRDDTIAGYAHDLAEEKRYFKNLKKEFEDVNGKIEVIRYIVSKDDYSNESKINRIKRITL